MGVSVCANELWYITSHRNQQLEDRKYLKFGKEVDSAEEDCSYQYLVSMPIYNLTEEKKLSLEEEMITLNKSYQDLLQQDVLSIWKDELDIFDKGYQTYLDTRLKSSHEDGPVIRKKRKTRTIRLKKKKTDATKV